MTPEELKEAHERLRILWAEIEGFTKAEPTEANKKTKRARKKHGNNENEI